MHLPERPCTRYLRDAADRVLEGDTAVQATAIVSGFFCVCAVAQTIMGPAFNPFTPIHKIAYTVTGVPDSVASTGAKPKED